MARITIIDDDIELTDNTAALLRKHGHSVSTLYTTEEAVSKVAADKPDLLILDVMFPDNPAAGFDLARQIRRTKSIKYLPIILLTGVNQEFPMNFSSEDIDPSWMPVQAFLEKPVQLPALLDKMNHLLQSR